MLSARLFILLCNLAYAIALMVLALIPRPPQAIPEIGVPDTVAHALAYGLLAGMLLWLLKSYLASGPAYIFAWFGATFYGLVTELAQLLVAARSFELADLAADAVGAALVLVSVGSVEIMGWGRRSRAPVANEEQQT
jgi:VanZ family protein